MDKILFLLKGDFDYLKKIHPKNNYLVSYMNDKKKEIEEAFKGLTTQNIARTDKVRLLVGNSENFSKNYLELAKQLYPYRNRLDLCFMCNYASTRDKYKDLLSYLKENLFTYSIWEEIVPIDKYIRFFSMYDIYVCNVDKQTGLGAISYAIYLGKSVYLQGFNYEWEKYLGYYVETTNQLIRHLRYNESLLFPSTNIEHNYTISKKLCSLEENYKKWDDALASWNRK